MKFNVSPKRASTNYKDWHRWFAWYPVRVGPHHLVWWERVERRGTPERDNYGGYYYVWEYRPLERDPFGWKKEGAS